MKKVISKKILMSLILFLILFVGCFNTPPTNQAPTITSTQITAATVDELYTYDVDAADPDGDTLTFSLTTKPTGMTINSTTGLISWTPTSTGDYEVTVRVSDGSLFVTQSFTIKVTTAILSIGDIYGGGKVAYILGAGDSGYDANVQHGLIAATADQSTYIQWCSDSNTNTGATETGIGSGAANTTLIVSNQGAGTYAAKLCDDLILNGYYDWYLPSKDELNKLYLNKDVVGGFVESTNYWSSSEYDAVFAWRQSFPDGYQYYAFKVSHVRVRAVRAF